jgi:hypothetical protein
VTLRSLGHGTYRIKVTARVGSMGANEAAIDTQPVYHATVSLGTAKTYTNQAGTTTIKLRHSRKLTVTAGDTLKPRSLTLKR